MTHESVIDELQGKKLLLAASTGGHLAQLNHIARLIKPHPDSLWVTFDKPQSRSLAKDGRRIEYIDYIAPRDLKHAVTGFGVFRRLLAQERFDAAISTGSAIAVSALPIARLSGVPAVYVESVSRYDGPSLSGRMLARFPGITLRTQHPEWATARWRYEFSVMDAWKSQQAEAANDPIKKVFVTLGTIQPYRFDTVVDSVVNALPEGAEVVWQLGATTRKDLPGTVYEEMPSSDFKRHVAESDVVVTHAGVGSIMELLGMGAHVIAVPRRKRRNEHVDDHQLQVATDVADRGLSVVVDAEELALTHLEQARSISAVIA